MTTSGTTDFTLANGQIVTEAFDRLGMMPPSLTRHHFTSARTSLNLELQDWSNRGVNLWKVSEGTINLVAGTKTYTLPTSLVALTDFRYVTVDLTGGTNTTDRLIVPFNRDDYAAIAMKDQQGAPTAYWFQRLLTPQVTLWQVPATGQGAPGYLCKWYGVSRIQDAGLGGGETPDLVYRGLDALCAGLTARLAEKFVPARLQEKKALATEAWAKFAVNDQEDGNVVMRPNFSAYGRI
jgi:hypothetical protein